MKKSWYMLSLIICAFVLGDVLCNHATGSWSWLSYKAGFEFQPGTLAITNVFSVTFGVNFYISVAQAIMIIAAFFLYYKTAEKICK